MKTLPTYFISHGGGPWPWMKKEMPFYDVLEKSLQEIPRQLGVTPKAILVISAHWEEKDFAIQAHPHPPMIYDYGGFPDYTYQIQYSAPGSPEVARRVAELLTQAGLPNHLDQERGYDHGNFTPLFVMYPKANVPIFQVSLKTGLSPAEHLQLGRALAPLRNEGILIVGSGLSYHNLRAMFSRDPSAGVASSQFDEWLEKVMSKDPQARSEALLHWEKAPSARAAHPREEHLIPLMVAVGAAENEKSLRVYHEDKFMGALATSSFRLGE